MRHPSHLMMLSLFIFLTAALFSFPVSAQPSPDEPENTEEVTTSETPDSEIQPGIVIPEDVPTRETFEPELENGPAIGPTAADYVRVFAGLVIVIVVIWALSLALKKFVTVRGLASTSESLKILHTVSLSPSRMLYLVRLGERILLIGGGEGGLRTLAEISDMEEVSQIMREIEYKGNFDLNPFKARLDGLMGEDDKSTYADEDLGVRQRKLQGMLDRLKDAGNNDSK